MKPVDPPESCGAKYGLGDGKNFVVYSPSSIPAGFTARSLDMKTGKLSDETSTGRGEIVWLVHP